MNKKHKLAAILFIGLVLTLTSGIVRANETNYAFVVFETTVTRQGVETSDENPEERRFYVSNVVAFSEINTSIYRNAAKEADEYFTATVVEPLKTKRILHQYYDDGVKINNKVVYGLETRAEVEELQQQILQDLKEQSANVFTFNWSRGAKSKGLETSQPILFYHAADKPLYGAKELKTSEQIAPQSPIKKGLRKN